VKQEVIARQFHVHPGALKNGNINGNILPIF